MFYFFEKQKNTENKRKIEIKIGFCMKIENLFLPIF